MISGLAALLAVGWSLRECAEGLARSKSSVHREAKRMRLSPVRRRRRERRAGVSPAILRRIDRLLDEAQLSQREIARRLGVNPSSVSRRVRKRLEQDVPGVPFTGVRKSYRCDVCGMVTRIKPCVRCYAGQSGGEES